MVNVPTYKDMTVLPKSWFSGGAVIMSNWCLNCDDFQKLLTFVSFEIIIVHRVEVLLKTQC